MKMKSKRIHKRLSIPTFPNESYLKIYEKADVEKIKSRLLTQTIETRETMQRKGVCLNEKRREPAYTIRNGPL